MGVFGRRRPATSFADTTWAALEPVRSDTLDSFDPRTLTGLPEPARRLLTKALPEGTPLCRVARLEMSGEIKLGRRWLPFTAQQILRAGVGFVWAPVVGGRVIRFVGADALGPDGARVEFRLHDRVPILNGSGPDIARSAAGRLAAETVAWLPQALTPQAGARWSPIDDHRATVTLTGPGGSSDIAVTVTVARDGRLSALALRRWRDSADPPAFAPFGGAVHTTFTTPEGVEIAGSGQVGWGWGTASQDDGAFFRYTVGSARFLPNCQR